MMRVVTSQLGFTRAFSIRVPITRNVVPTVIAIVSYVGNIQSNAGGLSSNDRQPDMWLDRDLQGRRSRDYSGWRRLWTEQPLTEFLYDFVATPFVWSLNMTMRSKGKG